MSQLKVNSIVPVGGVASGQGGGVIQTVQSQTTTTASNTTITMADTNLSASITPTSTSNKILIYITQSFQIKQTTAVGGGFQLLRGSTVIHKGAPTTTDGSNNVSVQLYFANFAANANFYAYHNMHFLDSPSTTSATTYKTQLAIAIAGSGREIIAQPTGTDSNGISTITLMEVSA